MTIAYKVLGQLNPAANTLTTIYTVPSATESVLSTVTICNLNNVNANVRLAVSPGNAAIDNKHYVVYDNLLRNNDTLTLTLGITLATTDTIRGYGNLANIAFNVFGSEIV
jgi:hypothetical protein